MFILYSQVAISARITVIFYSVCVCMPAYIGTLLCFHKITEPQTQIDVVHKPNIHIFIYTHRHTHTGCKLHCLLKATQVTQKSWNCGKQESHTPT